MSPVVRVGDSVRDADEPEVVQLKEKSLCENCFHQQVCSTATEAARIGALIAVCPHNLPVLEQESPPAPG